MDLKMFGDRVVFRPEIPEEKKEEKTASGIIIPTAVSEQKEQQRRNFKGTVLYKGNDCEFVEVGSTVAYDSYGVAAFFHNGEELLIVREKDLIGMYE